LVFKEMLRERQRERQLLDPASWTPRAEPDEEPDDERMEALQECLDRLPPSSRDLILDYHEGERRGRIDNRRAIAERLDIPLNALRIRVHRIRTRLERCVRRRYP
jgi:DNA-directed RNA polymerase specialized sigma24 family protein